MAKVVYSTFDIFLDSWYSRNWRDDLTYFLAPLFPHEPLLGNVLLNTQINQKVLCYYKAICPLWSSCNVTFFIPCLVPCWWVSRTPAPRLTAGWPSGLFSSDSQSHPKPPPPALQARHFAAHRGGINDANVATQCKWQATIHAKIQYSKTNSIQVWRCHLKTVCWYFSPLNTKEARLFSTHFKGFDIFFRLQPFL